MNTLIKKYNCDLARVSWAHAVNSKSSLTKYLKDDIDCIESDLSYNKDDSQVYMCHPPLLKSDLTFEEYWNICKNTDKVIKLDFKMIEAVESCLKLLNEEYFYKIILNADILKSKVSNKTPMDKSKFCNLCFQYAPGAMISIGWTTVKESNMGYTWSDIFEMNGLIHGLNNPDQLITIPVDEHMMSLNSASKLLLLLDQYMDGKVSLTIWSYKDVKVDLQSIKTLRKLLHKSLIFLDVPQLTDSEREEIFSTEPKSDTITRISCSGIEGKNFWCSRSSILIGENTRLCYEENLAANTVFFVVFDNSIKESGQAMSSCDVQWKSRGGSTTKLISLTRKGLSSENCLTQNDDNFETVYFLSINVTESHLKLTVSEVSDYNTKSMRYDNSIKQFSSEFAMTDSENAVLSIDAISCDQFCRFIVIDFCSKL